MAKQKKVTLPKNLRIYVGKRDIKRGQRGQTETCPVATAIKRRLPSGYKVRVWTNPDHTVSIHIIKERQFLCDEGVQFYKAGKAAARKINNYDNKKAFVTGHIRLTSISDVKLS